MSSHTTTTHHTSPTHDPAYHSITVLPLHTHTLPPYMPHVPHASHTTTTHSTSHTHHIATPLPTTHIPTSGNAPPPTHTHTHVSHIPQPPPSRLSTRHSHHNPLMPPRRPHHTPPVHLYYSAPDSSYLPPHRSVNLLHTPRTTALPNTHHAYNTTCMHSLTSQPRSLPSSSSNSPCHTRVNICLHTTCPSLVIPAPRPPNTHTTHPHQTTTTTYSPP